LHIQLDIKMKSKELLKLLATTSKIIKGFVLINAQIKFGNYQTIDKIDFMELVKRFSEDFIFDITISDTTIYIG
jgi:hypothetical protein